MANTLRFKRGLVSGIPTALAGEPLFTTDTFDLYIGNGTTNTRFQKYIASGTTSQLLRGDGSLLTMPIVLTSPANGQVLKFNGTSWVNDSDAGITGSGTTNYLPKFTGATTLGNSLVFDNGTNVLINTTTALWTAASRQTFEINGAAQSLLALNVANTSAGYLWHSGTYLSLANTRNSYINFITNSNETMRLDASGNLGLGVTPSAWQSVYRAFEVGNTSLVVAPSNTEYFGLGSNWFINSAGNFVYKNSLGTANIFETPLGGGFRWRIAPAGTAGNAITFTQAMTLTANGRLLLGTTTEGTQRLQVAGDVKFDADAATNGFYWDNTNKRLGIGLSNQEATLQVGTKLGSGANVYSFSGYRFGVENGTSRFIGGEVTGNNQTTTSIDIVLGGSAAWNNSTTRLTFSGFDRGNAFNSGTLGSIGIFKGGGLNTLGDGNLVFGTTPSGSSTPTERMRIDANGSVGIGTTSITGYSLRVNKIITGAATAYGVSSDGIVQSDVTGQAFGFNTSLGTQAASFTLPILSHYRADQSTFGAGSAVTTQYGFQVRSNLTGATNNYGFFGDLAAATGVWNLYMNGTANNYLGGRLGLGSTSLSLFNLRVSNAITGGTTAVSIFTDSVVQSDVTNIGTAYYSGLSTAAASFTLANLRHFYAEVGSFGAGSSVTTQVGFGVSSNLTGATNNYAFLGQIASGTGRWNLYMNGTAANYLNGNTLIGSTTDSGEKLQVNGTMKVTGNAAFDTNVLFVDATNNRVGMGTITPDTTLRVAGAINSTQAIFGNTDGRGLAISTSIVGGTNEAGVVLNARSSVTSGTFIFQTDGTQRMQLDSSGLTISGGNGYEVINSAATTVTALRPTGGGTSIMSTNSNGLHIAVGTEAAGDLILASNNTERIRLSSNGFFSQLNATNPSSSITDSYIQYSADVAAGNAAPHFRTENGAVVKLYQETTGVGNSIFSQGGGNSVLDDSTFDGYTLRQIVKALRNQGILQ